MPSEPSTEPEIVGRLHALVFSRRNARITFTDARRDVVDYVTPLNGECPPADAMTPEALARHVETVVCSFIGWDGNDVSDAELVYRVALRAIRRMQKLACTFPQDQTDHRALAERCADAEAKLTALREQVARGTASGDRCQFCLGAKGGEPGREQTVGGALACAECAELVQAAIENAQAPAAAEVTDADAVEMAAMFRATSASAAEIARQEAVGELVGLMTPVGGTVTDSDELEMHRRLAEQNIAICATCRNTGWVQGGNGYCECPYGWFLVKKTTTKE